MTGFWTLARKEAMEQRRTWKFLAMVGIFTVVALIVGIVPYIVAEVRDDQLGDNAAQDLLQAFSFTIIGLGTLLAIIVAMGSLANERASGTAAMTLSKPVTRAAFVASKFLGMVVSIYAALAISSAVMYILTMILVGNGDVAGFVTLMAIIGVYMVFIGSIAFFWSGVFTRQMVAGGLALLLFVVQQPLLIIPHTERYWPISTTTWGLSFMGVGNEEDWPAFLIALGLITLLSVGAWVVFRRKEL